MASPVFQVFEIGRLVVGGTVLPTSVQDSDPLKGEGAYGHLMRLSFVTLLFIKGAGPKRLADRLSGPLDKGLSQKFWAAHSPVHPGFVAAAVGHRCDAGVVLQIVGLRITMALFAESCQQAWGVNGSGAWQGIEECEVAVLTGKLGDARIETMDSIEGCAQLADERLDH